MLRGAIDGDVITGGGGLYVTPVLNLAPAIGYLRHTHQLSLARITE